MRNRLLSIASAMFVLVAGVWQYSASRASQITNPQPTLPADAVQAVTLIFGAKDMAPEKWDGSARISRGKIEKITGYHFTEASRILDGNAWQCATHPGLHSRVECTPTNALSRSPRRLSPSE